MKITEEEAKRRLSSGKNLANQFSSLPTVIESDATKVKTSQENQSNQPNPSNLALTGPQVEHILIGKSRRGFGITDKERGEIGFLASLPGGPLQKEIAAEYGIARNTVSNIKNGVSSSNPPTQERKAQIESRMESIKDLALLKLMSSLNLIDDEKLSDLSAKELGQFASNISKVVTSITPAAQNSGSQVNVVVYAPEIRKESQFREIEV